MKILYGIQGTGNGHITRSTQIISLLRKEHQVDILISGQQNKLSYILDVKYQFKGFDLLFKKSGKINLLKSVKNFDLSQFYKDLKSIDFKQYDLIISDFEPITAYGAKLNNIKSIGISNQNFIKKKTNNPFKKLFLNFFSPTDINISIHFFQNKAKNVFGPIIDLNLTKNTNEGTYILVYLSHWKINDIIDTLNKIELPEKIYGFQIFHPEVKSYRFKKNNIVLLPINRTSFVNEIKKCYGVITNSGFSTTSEALYLNKKIWSIPIENQFEQKFNAKTLSKKGYFVSNKINQSNFNKWVNHLQPNNPDFQNSANDIVDYINLILSKEIR